MLPMRSNDALSLSGYAFVAIAVFAGLFTWLCVGWFGHQPLVTAMVAVVLVELFLASFGLIAILLAERMTVKLLDMEKRPSPAPKPRKKQTPIWLRVPTPPMESSPVASASDDDDWNSTIRFPQSEESGPEFGSWGHRPAA